MATAVVVGIIAVWTLVASAAAMLVGAVIGRADQERRIVVEPSGSTLTGGSTLPANRLR